MHTGGHLCIAVREGPSVCQSDCQAVRGLISVSELFVCPSLLPRS